MKSAFPNRASLALGIALLALARSLAAAEPSSLAGQWRFALDRSDVGVSERWFTKNLPDKITLPGVLQAQGFGDEISVITPWVLSLYDRLWYLRADYAAYTNAGNVKVPFVCQPPRHYLGAAWYQRDVAIPTDWAGRRVTLFLERPRWETRVWLDDRLIGTTNSLCAPHEFDLGTVAPGQHRLTVRVDNRMLLPYRPDAHAVSDSLGSTWNGIVGAIELYSTPRMWIEEVRVFPKLETKSALVRGRLGNATSAATTNSLGFCILDRFDSRPRFPTASVTVVCPPGGADFEAEVTNTSPTVLWDEFTPHLFELTAMLNPFESSRQVKRVEFGFRDFRVVGQDFVINGRPTHLRGTHHGGDFPLTGYPPCDVEYWRKLFQTCKEWGMNHVRFHSFCPPEAAFTAADEVGIYLQPEPGMWNDISPGTPMEAMLYAETERMLKAYGNHPSFVLFSASNEAKGRWKEALPKWVKHFRVRDPRHLYTPDTGWSLIDTPGPVDGADFIAVHRIGGNLMRGERGWFGRDYAGATRGLNVPIITHEVGQWCAYPDFDVIRKFTGYMRPGNYEIFRDSALARGRPRPQQPGGQDDGAAGEGARAPAGSAPPHLKDLAAASGRFQLACYKEEIEANLRTPGLGGFQLLDLHDYVGQGTALVGVLDPFWEEKGYVKAGEWRQFCSETVPLARLTKRVFTTAERLAATVEVAHYGPVPLSNTPVATGIRGAAGHWAVQPSGIQMDFAIGRNPVPLATGTSLADLPAPAAYQLVAKVGSFENSWNFWLYPAPSASPPPTNVLIASSWVEAEASLLSGRRVLFLPRSADLGWDSPPLDRVPVFWNRLMNPGWSRFLGLWCDTNHPALAGFPTADHCDWQWTELTRGARAINLDRAPRELQPVVQAIDDWNRNWKLGGLFEAKVGSGRLLVCAFDLQRDLENRPVAAALRQSLLHYAASEGFRPQVTLTPEQARDLWFDTRVMTKLGATAEAAGNSASAVLDGDPNTFWSVGGSGRGSDGRRHPHELTLTFTNAVAMTGVVLMNRQNDRDHLGDIRGYTLAVSDDGQTWREVSKGELASTWDPQTVKFPATVTAKALKLTALAGFGADTSAALADLAVLYAGPKLPENSDAPVEFRRPRSTSSDVDEGNEAPAPRRNPRTP